MVADEDDDRAIFARNVVQCVSLAVGGRKPKLRRRRIESGLGRGRRPLAPPGVPNICPHDVDASRGNERLKTFVAQGASVIRASAALKRTTVGIRAQARKLGIPFPPTRDDDRSDCQSSYSMEMSLPV